MRIGLVRMVTWLPRISFMVYLFSAHHSDAKSLHDPPACASNGEHQVSVIPIPRPFILRCLFSGICGGCVMQFVEDKDFRLLV
jgi:hypothetical protein